MRRIRGIFQATALVLLLVGFDLQTAAAQTRATAATGQERLVESLRAGGVAVLIRHSATVPGAGDPPGFELADCATQRNLSDAGREQARRIGEWFERNGIVPTSVQNSLWCRARDTARLAFGREQDWPPLGNLFTHPDGRVAQAREVRRGAIAAVGQSDIAVMVSHGTSINAFVGVYLAQGEMVVVRASGRDSANDPAAIEVLGRHLVP